MNRFLVGSFLVSSLAVGCSSTSSVTPSSMQSQISIDILGIDKRDAIDLLKKANLIYRFCDLDEGPYGCAMTEDFIIDRYTVYLHDGVVVFYEVENEDGVLSFGERPFKEKFPEWV